MTAMVPVALIFDFHLGYARGVLRGIKEYAQSRPDWVLLPLDTERVTRELVAAAHPKGLIASVLTEGQSKLLLGVRQPIVNVASVLPGLPFPRVGVDHRLVGQAAAEHLRYCALQHFAYVGNAHHLYSTEREIGFRDALAVIGHTVDSYYERRKRSYRQRGRLLVLDERLRRWLQALPKPVGIFAGHDVWALQVVEACRLAGLRVPEDVAVVGVDNDDLLCELARPSLSSVIVPAERVGYEAAALLDRLLAGEQPPRDPVLIPPPGVVSRQSSDVLAIDDPVVAQTVRFLRDSAHLPLRVADVLRAVPVSRRALERRFQAALERGLAAEIRRLHVDKAKQLLADSELPMQTIAERCGFSSQYQFSRAFRREVGTTPTNYRAGLRHFVPHASDPRASALRQNHRQ
jgi:LacI family transcriptional regulator